MTAMLSLGLQCAKFIPPGTHHEACDHQHATKILVCYHDNTVTSTLTSLELMTFVKEIIIFALTAMITVTVAIVGIRRWIVELRGRTSFEVARGIMLATYRLRDVVAQCRSTLVTRQEFPEDYPGTTKTSAKEELDGWTYVYKNRWRPVWEALQDYDARALESEALWGSDVRTITNSLRALVMELHIAIDAFLSDKFHRGEDFRSDPEFRKEMHSKLSGSIGTKDNLLSERLESAVSAIEERIRPHIGPN